MAHLGPRFGIQSGGSLEFLYDLTGKPNKPMRFDEMDMEYGELHRKYKMIGDLAEAVEGTLTDYADLRTTLPPTTPPPPAPAPVVAVTAAPVLD